MNQSTCTQLIPPFPERVSYCLLSRLPRRANGGGSVGGRGGRGGRSDRGGATNDDDGEAAAEMAAAAVVAAVATVVTAVAAQPVSFPVKRRNQGKKL